MSIPSTPGSRSKPRVPLAQNRPIKATSPQALTELVEPPGPSHLELLGLVKGQLRAAEEAVDKVVEELEEVKKDLKLQIDSEEGGLRVTGEKQAADQEDPTDVLFAAVRDAVAEADETVDRICYRSRHLTGPKGVTAVLEKLADDVWRYVAENLDKPLTSRLVQTLNALSELKPSVETASTAVHTASGHVETIITQQTASEAAPLPSPTGSGKTPRDELAAELQAEGQRMLGSFQRYAGSKKTDKSALPDFRSEMDDILTDMVTTVQSTKSPSGFKEDTEGWKLKKEVARIRQRIQGLCKALAEAEQPESTKSRRQPSLVSEDFERFSEQSERSSLRPHSYHSSLSLETEELKSEISRHLTETKQDVMSALKEHKVGMSSMNQVQLALQMKQESINNDLAEIKKRLFAVFPAAQEKGKAVDMSKSITLLKSFAPEIRASTDMDFLEKFTKLVARERREQEAFLTAIRNEGYSCASLDESIKEFAKLKAENACLQDAHEEDVLNFIRLQSEYEIEGDYQKTRSDQLEAELTNHRQTGGVVDSRELAALRAQVQELTTENARLRGDAFDLSIVEPTTSMDDDYSKNDEMAFLKLQLHQRQDRLARLEEEKTGLEERIASMAASPADMMTLVENRKKYEREAAEVRKLSRQIDGEATESVAGLELKQANEKQAAQLMVLLNLTGPFEICGTVNFSGEEWALVKVGEGFTWVRTNLERYKLSNEEMLSEHLQAANLLKTHSQLPKNVVLALGQLLIGR